MENYAYSLFMYISNTTTLKNKLYLLVNRKLQMNNGRFFFQV